MNEQTYLNTVCRSRRPPECKHKPKDGCYLECCCDTSFGKLTVRANRHNTGICLDICHPEPRRDCDHDRHGGRDNHRN